MNTKTLDAIRAEGFARGKLIASWIDIPTRNSTVMFILVTDERSATDAMFRQACRAEEQNRSFPEFEPTRHELDSHPDRDGAWDAYADGVVRGIREQVDAAMRAIGRHHFEN